MYLYRPDSERDEPAILALTEAAERDPRYGFKKLFQVLRRQSHTWNHKQVHRIYCLLKLNFRRKGKQRLPARNPAPLASPPELVNRLYHDALAIEIDMNIPAQHVVRVLDKLVANLGYPLKMRMDNGPELVSLAQWAEEYDLMLEFIKPGKPTQNAFIERFNLTWRTEILDFYLSRTLNEAREITGRWLTEYSSEHLLNS